MKSIIHTLTIALTVIGSASPAMSQTQSSIADTLRLDDVSVTAIKQGNFLGDQAVAYTLVDSKEIQRLNIVTMKDVSEVAPNFYIPSYGSRMTSSIYVRGIGARIDQPVVGLNVDNVAFLNKDNYDFEIADIERIEVLRGPQSTLYGRNTMGGQVNIYTLSPFNYQGGRLMAEYGNGPTMKMNIAYYKRYSQRLAMSWSGQLNYSGGFWHNKYDDYAVGREKGYAFRWKTCAKLSSKLTLENIAALQISRQNGYPYAYEPSGEINYNDTCYYRRNSFNDGLTIKWMNGNLSVSSITSFQFIDDNMTLDQDFLPLNYFTLTQDRKEYAATQDIVASGKSGAYNWLAGAFAFIKSTKMDAPVTFKDHGIKALITDHRNEVNPDYPIRWDSDEFVLGSHFTYPVAGLALYHQSRYDLGRFTFTGSLRLDYEHATLKYHSRCTTSFTTMKREADGAMSHFSDNPIDIDDRGKLSDSFLQLLPKISVLWRIPEREKSNVYASVAKGYKSGGFNTQMFSDVLQQRLMNLMGLGMTYDIDDIVSYKPEKSWNYEVGAHIECANGKVVNDIAVFYIDCRDQQLTMFPDGTTTGRITTNAGKTRSCGAEIAMRYTPSQNWMFNVSYGFTNAKFVKFNNGQTSYAHKNVPYAPQNTLFGGVTFTTPLKSWIDRIEINANVRGVGKIYWGEDNATLQKFYAIPSFSVRGSHRQMSLTFWAENLTSTKYNVFSFVSIGNRFVQKGNPLTYGATLRVNFETGKPF